jgi:hypothetical protein
MSELLVLRPKRRLREAKGDYSIQRKDYYVMRLMGNPLIALPYGSQRVRLAGVSRIQGFTPKRAVFKNALRVAVATGLDRLIGEPTDSPLAAYQDFDFTEWLRRANGEFEPENSVATVIWPWPPGRYRGRIYVHVLDDSGYPVAFSKLALDNASNEKLLAEEQMLKMLGQAAFRYTRIPRILSSGSFQGHRYLSVEPLPITTRPVKVALESYPAEVVAEIAGDTTMVGIGELSSMTWWNSFLKRAEEVPEFLEDVMTGSDGHGVRLCRVHGDFEPKNLVKDGRATWVLDWEDGDLHGPWLTDPIRYYTLVCARECRRRPARVLSDILRLRGSDRSSRLRLDVGMALAFLHGVGSAEATQLLRNWRRWKEAAL